ncbi:MAG: iron hydrogenase small subunit [Deltaproteobacteria bacterium]|nr:iron hydrogenase small subunit [Deltaproteobacteria bacterium]MBN2671546.1 iron hydrogenase small subunit [Deltaproteobacteria bacterium]
MTKLIGYINGRQVEFDDGKTVLEVARENGHFIPTLCKMGELNHAPATCRVCLAEIERQGNGGRKTVTTCNTPMEANLHVYTRTQNVREKQRLQVELLLADHDQDCATCVRHGDCELQDVAQFVGLQQTRFGNEAFYQSRTRDSSSPAIVRDMTKCIRCFRCVTVCRDVQGVDVLTVVEKGLSTEIGVRDSVFIGGSDCVSCGQCTLVCPVGALAEVQDAEPVVDFLYDPEIFTVFQFAPAVRVALGEEFGLAPGTNVEGELITALRRLGADVVLDTNFTADLVIMEEGTELMSRLKTGGRLPMFTSCSPGWINFMEKNYPEMLEHLSTTKSPQQCFGAIAKSYLAQRMNVAPERMRVISIMPCTAKKGEAGRPEFYHNKQADVDVVLTTREFGRLLRREGIHLPSLQKGSYDNPWMGAYTGAAEIFGTTGGVMEAALRSVYYLAGGKELEQIELQAVRGLDDVRTANIDIPGLGVAKVAVAHGLKAARKIVEQVKNGEAEYHFVEVMTCPGGCICGGGQPKGKKSYHSSKQARQQAIYAIDTDAVIRQSHNNPLIKQLYDNYLGAPNSHLAHKLLHTSYVNRQREIRHTMKEIWEEIS